MQFFLLKTKVKKENLHAIGGHPANRTVVIIIIDPKLEIGNTTHTHFPPLFATFYFVSHCSQGKSKRESECSGSLVQYKCPNIKQNKKS